MDDKGPVRPTVLNSPLDPTRARPEPWFVGSGRGLMIAVVSLCVVLLVLRGVTMIWLAEAVWKWLVAQRSRAADPVSMRGSRARDAAPGFAARLPTVPPASASVGPTPAGGNPAASFGADAYPAEAMRRGEQGRVSARLSIGADGKPTGCTVTGSSGSAALDRQTCFIAYTKTRFRPARDQRGHAIPSTYLLNVRWVLPD